MSKKLDPTPLRIHCKYDELVELKTLKPNPKNPNQHSDEQIERLAEVIKYQGIRRALRVSKRSGLMTVGHGQLLALKKLGQKAVPVDFQDYEDDAQEYADLVADNSLGAWSSLDLSAINTAMLELGPDFNVELFGIKDFEIEPADKEPAPEKKKKSCPACGYQPE